MFVQNFIKLSAAVYELWCPQRKKENKKASRRRWKQYCRRYRGKQKFNAICYCM